MSAILVILLFLGWQPAVKNARGNELYQQEKYDEALAAYDEALAEDGENPALHYNRGNALARAGAIPDAIQAYERALDLEPDNLMIQQNYDLFREINDRINESGR